MQFTTLLLAAFSAASASALSIRDNIQPFKLLPLNAPLPIANMGYLQFTNSTPSTVGLITGVESNQFVGVTQKASKEGQVFQYNTASNQLYLTADGTLGLDEYYTIVGEGVRFDDFTIALTSETPNEWVLGYAGVNEKVWSACETEEGYTLKFGEEGKCGEMFSIDVQYNF